jgi:capsular polysaccharide biosynthesis protein
MLTDVKTDQKRKIYIARSNNNNRKLVNELEIIALCVSYGFEIVYPEKFSFEEQLKLFNSAKYIIGPAGAAFSNLIFCQKGTVVINFLAEENKEASIFSNLCTLSESSYYLETGKLLKERMFFSDTISWLYSNYKVDIQALDERLKSIVIEQ